MSVRSSGTLPVADPAHVATARVWPCRAIDRCFRGVRRVVVALTSALFLSSTAHASQWAEIYDTGLGDLATSAEPTADGGYVVAGATNALNLAGFGAWVLKLDTNGAIVWQQIYDSAGEAGANSVHQLDDGGYVVAGYRNPTFTDRDAWVLRLDPAGNVIWQKAYGGAGDDSAKSLERTSDGGYIMAGYSTSFGAGNRDGWILKLDADGNVIWQKTYGGTGPDEFNSVAQTADGGYVLSGYTSSFGAGGRDAWVLKLDTNGNVMWERTYGGIGEDVATSAVPTPDGGYIVAGYMPTAGPLDLDAWLMKLDLGGNIVWQKTYHAGFTAYAFAVQAAADGGYIVGGGTMSPVTGQDGWLLKVDGSGKIVWQSAYGGFGLDSISSVRQTPGGGYVAVGQTDSFGTSGESAWVLKIDDPGSIPCVTTVSPMATSVDGSAVTGISAATVSATNATPSDTFVVPQAAHASTRQQCFSPTAPVSVPALSEWAMPLMAALLALFARWSPPPA